MSEDDYPYQRYGAPYGEQPPPSYGYGGYPPPRPHARGEPNVSGIVALALNLFSVVSCCNVLGVVGAALAGLSLRSGTAPEKARTLTVASWVVLVAGFLMMAVLFVYLGVNGHFDD
ncbi:hypothetical protein ACQEUU_28830 [Nonomuraea sp. CA-218870]|uniref:hypothetical protein n=1 Tax=Nonomuraea sp. CA-218870 TaxID=3239998 RepID=UPI003D950321